MAGLETLNLMDKLIIVYASNVIRNPRKPSSK
jgi:hypothetical protein